MDYYGLKIIHIALIEQYEGQTLQEFQVKRRVFFLLLKRKIKFFIYCMKTL